MSKKRKSRGEIELAALSHLLEYMQIFLDRYSRPRQRFDKLEAAIEEVGKARLMLLAEVEGGAPSLRRLRLAEREEEG